LSGRERLPWVRPPPTSGLRLDARRNLRFSSLPMAQLSNAGRGLLLCGMLSFATPGFADTASSDKALAQVTRLTVEPSAFALSGPRDMRQLVVTGHFADGGVRDVTSLCSFKASIPNIQIGSDGLVRPLRDGSTDLTVTAGTQTATVKVQVNGYEQAT